MADRNLWQLCSELAAGTETQYPQAWRQLILDGRLPALCRENVEQERLDDLKECWELLSSSGALGNARRAHRELAWASPDGFRDSQGKREAEVFLERARRLVGAAVAAALARQAPDDPAAAADLPGWAYRAVALREPPRGLAPAGPGNPTAGGQRLTERVRRCLARLPDDGAPDWPERLASVRAATRSLLAAHAPPRRLRDVPILLVLPGAASDATGGVVGLTVERHPAGDGQFFFRPDVFQSVSEAFRTAAHTAWRRVGFPAKYDVVWSIDGDLRRPIDGRSAQATVQVALTLLAENRAYDHGFAISAEVDDRGRLARVEELVRGGRPGPKLVAAARHGVKAVIVCPENYQEILRAGATPVGGTRNVAEILIGGRMLRIVRAVTVVEARNLACGLIEQLQRLLDGELRWVVDQARRRLGNGVKDWPSLDRLFVPVQMARGLRPTLGEKQYRELERRRAQGDHDGLDDAENRRFDLRAREAQRVLPQPRRTEPWEELREPLTRLVVLGDPGFGKTMLLWHETARRCQAGRRQLAGEGFRVDQLEHAAFLRADELAAELENPGKKKARRTTGGKVGNDRDGKRVCALMANILMARHGLARSIGSYLRGQLGQGRCLIVIDGLDEAPQPMRGRLDQALEAFIRQCPDARLLLSSRLAGYTGAPTAVADEDQCELLAFDDSQMRQAAWAWFAHSPSAADAFWNHVRGLPQIHAILRCPLLLRLACQAAAEAIARGDPLPRWDCRAGLYQTFLDDAVEQWCRRAETRPTREQRSLFPQFASRLALGLWKLDARRTLWDAGTLAREVNQLRGKFLALRGRNDLLGDLCASGLIVPAGPDAVGTPLMFTHRSFGEYLAACALAELLEEDSSNASRRVSAWRLADQKAWDPDWEQVVLFLAGRLREPEHLLERLRAEGPTKANPHGDDLFRHRLTLAARCLREICGPFDERSPPASLAGEIADGVASMWWANLARGTVAAVPHMTRAMPALARANATWGDTRLLTRLADLLRRQDGVRRLALEAVGCLGPAGASPEIVEAVADLTKDRCVRVSRAATWTLAALGTNVADRPDRRAAQASTGSEPAPAPRGEQGIGRRDAAPADALGEHDAPPGRAGAPRQDGLGAPGDSRTFRSAASDVDASCRIGAAIHVARTLLARLTGRAGEPSADRRDSKAGSIPDGAAADLLTHEDALVRWMALSVATEVGSPTDKQLRDLVRLLDHDDFATRWTASEAVGRLSDEGLRVFAPADRREGDGWKVLTVEQLSSGRATIGAQPARGTE